MIIFQDTRASSIEAVRVLDNLLVQLASSVDTDIMPGEFDPANQILPQQPLHPCLFPSEFTFGQVGPPLTSLFDFSGECLSYDEVGDEPLHVLRGRHQRHRHLGAEHRRSAAQYQVIKKLVLSNIGYGSYSLFIQ